MDEAEAEGQKERKLRERSEEYTRSLEAEVEKLQQYVTKQGGGTGAWTEQQELSRVRAELERCSLEHSEQQQQLSVSSLTRISSHLNLTRICR